MYTIKPLVWYPKENGSHTAYTIFGKVTIDGSDTLFWDYAGCVEETGFTNLYDAKKHAEECYRAKLLGALDAVVRPMFPPKPLPLLAADVVTVEELKAPAAWQSRDCD